MTYYIGCGFICQKFKRINASDWILKLNVMAYVSKNNFD